MIFAWFERRKQARLQHIFFSAISKSVDARDKMWSIEGLGIADMDCSRYACRQYTSKMETVQFNFRADTLIRATGFSITDDVTGLVIAEWVDQSIAYSGIFGPANDVLINDEVKFKAAMQAWHTHKRLDAKLSSH